MSDAETLIPADEATAAPESILAAAAPPDLRPLYDRQLKMLGELAELGLDAARAVVKQANADEPPPASDIALAYARVSRAVRLCIMLQSKLIEAKDEEEALQEMFTPRYGRKARVERIVERIVDAQAEDEEAADAMVVEAGERLDDEDLYGDLMERPLGEIVGRLCRDLGLQPDWSELSQELWARREAGSGIPLPLDGGEARSGGDRPAAAALEGAEPIELRRQRTGHPHPPPFPDRGGRELVADSS